MNKELGSFQVGHIVIELPEFMDWAHHIRHVNFWHVAEALHKHFDTSRDFVIVFSILGDAQEAQTFLNDVSSELGPHTLFFDSFVELVSIWYLEIFTCRPEN